MSLAILIVGHGSPRAEANAALTGMVERIAARVDGVRIAPAFFSIASPSIPHVVAELAEGGATRFVLAPYFLYEGQHVTVDVPKLLATCRERYPDATFEVLPTLQDAPALEDLMVARVQAFAPVPELPTEGAAIERRSHAIIDRRLGPCDDEGVRAIVRRVVHAAADYSFAESLRIHPDAVARGVAALREQRPIVCDVNMLKAGLTKAGVDVLCSVSDPDVIERAGPDMTRSAAAMEKLAERYDGGIVAIGNAPTALWKVMEIAAGGPRPALVVGLPVGFVGAREAKMALLETDLCYVTNVDNKGGSPVAAAAVNALALLARE